MGCVNLKEIYSGYDLIFCHDLIDRLYNQDKFFDDIPKRLNQDGLLVIFSSSKNIKNDLKGLQLIDKIDMEDEIKIMIWKK